MSETLFNQIIAREIPADIIYEDEVCLAFKDIAPQAPHHILIIPKKQIRRLVDAVDEDRDLLGHLLLTAKRIADDLDVSDNFRLIINNGEDSGQTVWHLHVHLLAGRSMNWPPG